MGLGLLGFRIFWGLGYFGVWVLGFGFLAFGARGLEAWLLLSDCRVLRVDAGAAKYSSGVLI